MHRGGNRFFSQDKNNGRGGFQNFENSKQGRPKYNTKREERKIDEIRFYDGILLVERFTPKGKKYFNPADTSLVSYFNQFNQLGCEQPLHCIVDEGTAVLSYDEGKEEYRLTVSSKGREKYSNRLIYVDLSNIGVNPAKEEEKEDFDALGKGVVIEGEEEEKKEKEDN
jgi:hypothetical protein